MIIILTINSFPVSGFPGHFILGVHPSLTTILLGCKILIGFWSSPWAVGTISDVLPGPLNLERNKKWKMEIF
jgi:hypothetical protein